MGDLTHARAGGDESQRFLFECLGITFAARSGWFLGCNRWGGRGVSSEGFRVSALLTQVPFVEVAWP